MKTAIITTDSFLKHDTGLGHPERADRVSVIVKNLKKFEKKLVWKKPITFDIKFLKITHSSKYVKIIENSFPKKGFSYLDGDTVVSPGSKEATFDAVGSIISAIDGVINKADYVICLWDDGVVKGGGTHGEVTIAYHFNIPVYLVNTLPFDELSGWIFSCCTEVFPDFTNLKKRLLELFG